MGSIPITRFLFSPTKKDNCITGYADMAELADALDLGSSSSECRFDSCYPHDKSLITPDIAVIRLF